MSNFNFFQIKSRFKLLSTGGIRKRGTSNEKTPKPVLRKSSGRRPIVQTARRIGVQHAGECKCNDSVWSLYSRILIQFRLNAGLPDVPRFAFRFGDTLNNILQKILNVLNASPVPPIPPIPPFDECCPPPHGDWGLVIDPATIECDWGLVAELVTCSEDWGTL